MFPRTAPDRHRPRPTSRPDPRPRRRLALAAAATAALFAALLAALRLPGPIEPPPARAAARAGSAVGATAPLTIVVTVYDDSLAVRSDGDVPPEVKFLDAGGERLATADNVTRQGTGWWSVYPIGNHMTDPGRTIEVRARGMTERLTLPTCDIRVDAAAGTVHGRTPWPGNVEVSFTDRVFNAGLSPMRSVATQPDGTFVYAPPPGEVIGPGTLARVQATTPRGHWVTCLAAAPLALIQYPGSRWILDNVRVGNNPFDRAGNGWVQLGADPDGEAILTASKDGTERWRMVKPRDAMAGDAGEHGIPTDPLADVDRLELRIDDQLVAAADVPRVRARFDPELRRLDGVAAAGRIVEAVFPAVWPARWRQTAASDGRFGFTALGINDTYLPHDEEASLVSWLGDGIAVQWPAIVAQEHVLLGGPFLGTIVDSSEDRRDIRLLPAGGGQAVARRVYTPRFEGNVAAFIDRQGVSVPIRPGDRLEVDPPGGVRVELTVPRVAVQPVGADGTFAVDASQPGHVIVDQARPTDGWLLPPDVWPAIDAPRLDVALGADGRPRFRCIRNCLESAFWVILRPPWTGAAHGRPAYRYVYLPRPVNGAAVELSELRGFASAGAAVTATRLTANGAAVETRAATATVQEWTGRPARWSIAWSDRFPGGLPAGTRFVVHVDGRRHTLLVPDGALATDVLRDTVSGAAAPRTPVDVWAYPNMAIDAARVRTRARTVAGADGRWSVDFTPQEYNVRAGDAIGINLGPNADHVFFQHDIGFVDGPFEPRISPTPPATATATPSPTRTPGPVPSTATSAATPTAAVTSWPPGRSANVRYVPWAGR